MSNCRNDFNSCGEYVPSNCIIWQGDIYNTDKLKICLGDNLTYIVNTLLSNLQNILNGRNIELVDLTNEDVCPFLLSYLPEESKQLIDIIRALEDAICGLNDMVETNTNILTDFTDISNYDLKDCITVSGDSCSSDVSFRTLIQAIITQLCDLTTQVASISESILSVIEDATGNFLAESIKSCGNNGFNISGTGASTVVTFEALVPPYCPIIFTGSLSEGFTMAGVGLENTPYCGYYVCNGNNGTPNSSTLPQNADNSIVYIMRFN